MSASDWITRSVSRCARRKRGARPSADGRGAPQAPPRSHARAPGRHAAPQRRGAVAARAAPHAGRAAGDRRPAASARSRAGAAPRRVAQLVRRRRRRASGATCWLLMSEQFAPDPQKVKARATQYDAALGTPDEAAAEVHLRRATGVAARAPAAALRRRPRRHALPGRPARRTAAAPEGRQAPAARWMPSWSTCSPPGSTSASSTCAASAGTRRPR